MNVKDITEQYSSLPASQIASAVNEALTHNGSLVVTAPPGTDARTTPTGSTADSRTYGRDDRRTSGTDRGI